MLLTNWLRSLTETCRRTRSRRIRNQRSAHWNRYQPALSRRPIGIEELEERTLLTSMISIDDVSRIEGDTGTTSVSFTVTRTGTNPGDLNESLVIDFTTQDGSATVADDDYVEQSGSLEFAADSTSTLQTKYFSIQILGDYAEEGDESFQVVLTTQMSGVSFLKDTGNVTIYDDEYRRIEESQLLAPPAPVVDEDHFGQTIAVDGDTMVVCAPDSDLVASDAGAVYIYQRNRQGTADETDDTWSYSATLTAFDGSADDQFGSRVAISGDTIVIGAEGADLNEANEGAVYVYRFSNGQWGLEAKLTASDAGSEDQFGSDVAIENDLIVIGARLYDVPFNNDSGAAYIFSRSGSTWSEDQILTATEFSSSGNKFGTFVAIENGEVFVTARQARFTQYGSPVGSIFTYQNNAGTWEKQQQLTIPSVNLVKSAGSEMVVSGNHAAIVSADYSHVYLYENRDGSWEYQQVVSPFSPSSDNLQIHSLDLHETTLIVGTIARNGYSQYAGAVTEYQLLRDEWIRTQDYYGSTIDNTTGFGTSVALADSQIIVGEPGADAAVLNSGLIHVLGPFAPGYKISDVSKYEGDSGETLFEFTIERKASKAGDLNFTSTVNFSTIDGTATIADGDYQSRSGTLTFAADPDVMSQFQTVTVVVNGDETYEGRESFYLALSNPTNGAQLIDSQGEASIEADDKAIVEFSEAEYTVTEGDDKVWVTLKLNEVFVEDVVVFVSYEEGTARRNTDFTPSPTTVTIPAGQLSATFSIDITQDDAPEDLEDFFLFLPEPPDANFEVQGNYKTRVIILNDDLIEISIDDVEVHEYESYAYVFLTASKPVPLPLVFHYTTQDTSATSPDDYTGTADSYVRFAGGDLISQALRFPIINDTDLELDESFLVNLTYVTGNNVDIPPVIFTDTQAEVTIIDDDRPSVYMSNVTVNESAGSVTLTAKLNKTFQDPVSVNFNTMDQSAVQLDDYTATSGTIMFAPGETSKTITVPIFDSDVSEQTETFLVRLSNLVSDGIQYPIKYPEAQVTIRDKDISNMSITNRSVNEADGNVTLTVSLDRAVDTEISVDYVTSDQTAHVSEDYDFTSGTLTFAAGETSKTITVPIVDSDLLENAETFFVNLTNLQAQGRPVNITDSQGEVTILDDDSISAEVNLRVVTSPSATQPDGSRAALPTGQDWVHEWSTWWVEIWVTTSNQTGQGIAAVDLDLSYNTAVTSVTGVEFASSFTQNQARTIDDQSGQITGLHAETTVTDLGIDEQLLFARIRFQPQSEDQVLLDFDQKSIGPVDLAIQSDSLQIKLTGDVAADTTPKASVDARIYANPYDLNDDDIISYRDLILFASVYQATPSQSGSKYAWFADLNQDDAVGYRDLIFVAANYGKSKQNPQPMVYPANFPAAWNQLLVAETFDTSDSVPAPASAPVTQAIVQTAFSGVINQVSDSLSEEQNQILQTTEIVVADLEGDTLGRAAGGTIYIDVNAAGYGWYVDVSPLSYDDFYFESELTLIALPGSEADGLFDLQTVIIHELGHLLGFEHREDGLMQDTLAPGIRLLPDWELNLEFEQDLSVDETDAFFLDLPDDAVLSPF